MFQRAVGKIAFQRNITLISRWSVTPDIYFLNVTRGQPLAQDMQVQ